MNRHFRKEDIKKADEKALLNLIRYQVNAKQITVRTYQVSEIKK